MDLKKRAQEVIADKRNAMRDFAAMQPDHPFTLANKDQLELEAQTSWNATGVLSMTGVMWWAMNLSLDLAYPHTIIFNATGGPDFDFSIFTSAVTGYFMVDPSTLGGEYQFTMEAVAGVAGEVSLDLYDMNWTQIGSFLGVVAGVSLSKLSGTGTLTYH
ncbi:MAG: hypothetical protein AAGM22_07895 [Acidobacteriota bacterium]